MYYCDNPSDILETIFQYVCMALCIKYRMAARLADPLLGHHGDSNLVSRSPHHQHHQHHHGYENQHCDYNNHSGHTLYPDSQLERCLLDDQSLVLIPEDELEYKDNIRYVHIGRMLGKAGRALPPEVSKLWVVYDWAGWIGVMATWFLVLIGEFMLITNILIPSPRLWHSLIHGILHEICVVLGLVAHWRATFMDPVSILCGLQWLDKYTYTYKY